MGYIYSSPAQQSLSDRAIDEIEKRSLQYITIRQFVEGDVIKCSQLLKTG